jgi:hypothetical protein
LQQCVIISVGDHFYENLLCEHFNFAYLDFEKFALGYWLTGNFKLRQFLLQQRFLELKM